VKIGIFDSGIGGISILKQLIDIRGLELIYVADTAHVPYGKRSQQEIQVLTLKSIEFLLQQQVDLIIIACHTASTNALEFLKEKFPNVPFIDVVDLVIDQALASTISGKIGILGTKATIAREIHKKRLLHNNPYLQVFPQACPRLASAIEKEYNDIFKITKLVDFYTKPLLNYSIDTIILGCTHYELIKPIIQQKIGHTIKVISAENSIKAKIRSTISLPTTASSIYWFITGKKNQFRKTLDILLPPEIKSVSLKKITI
jgi:glutamate racemase